MCENFYVDFDNYEDKMIQELHRQVELGKLRKKFKSLWQQIFQSSIPNQAFVNWLFESLANSHIKNDPNQDPVIPKYPLQISDAIQKYISLRIPVKISYAQKGSLQYFQNIEKYIDESKKYLINKQISLETFEILKKSYQNDDLVRQIRSYISNILKPQIEQFCLQLIKQCEISYQILSQNFEKMFLRLLVKKNETYYTLELKSQKTSELMKKQLLVHKIGIQHFEKLQKRNSNIINIFILLHRYNSLFNTNNFGWHLATPVKVLNLLEQDFEVSFECFASPFNCYFQKFCSVFQDTDDFYGSQGSFFNYDFSQGGSFQAGPPYDSFIFEQMSRSLLHYLEICQQALSFICILPDWDCDPINKLKESKFCTEKYTLPKSNHKYVNGAQHICKKSELYVVFETNTLVLFIQNQKGFEKWTPKKEFIEKQIKAWNIL